MNSFSILILIILSLFSGLALTKPYDLTIVGTIRYSSSVGRIPIVLINYLKDSLGINFMNFPGIGLFTEDLPQSVKNIIEDDDKTPGRIALLTECLSYRVCQPYKIMPDSYIKLAFSTIESTAIPSKWVFILNNYFDAVIVPDEFLVKVYNDCGVKIPIFVLSYPMDLDEFYKAKRKIGSKNPFVFGVSASFTNRKNLELLINAFDKVFKNNKKVKLVLHSYSGSKSKIEKLIEQLEINNVEIIWKEFDKKQYVDFLSTIDCYTLLSKGEGFSCTEKEALCMGIPCIVADNTALKSICMTGYVKAVKSDTTEPFYCKIYSSKAVGYCFNCSISDVSNALFEVYNNYDYFLEKAKEAREFIYQNYSIYNLKQRYLTLFKPQKVILGNKNAIKNGVLITTSKKIYTKYLNLVKNMLKVL